MMWRRGDEEETRALTHHHHHGGTSNRRRKGRRRRRRDRLRRPFSAGNWPSSPPRRARRSRWRLCVTCKARGRQSMSGAATNASSSSSSSVLTEQKRTRSNDLDERGMLLGARSFDEGRSTGVEYDREKRINLSTEKKASTAALEVGSVRTRESGTAKAERRRHVFFFFFFFFFEQEQQLNFCAGIVEIKSSYLRHRVGRPTEEFEKDEGDSRGVSNRRTDTRGRSLCNGRTELKTHNMQ